MRPECDRRAAVRFFYLSLVRVKTTEIPILCARIVLSVLPSFEFMLMLERADCFTLTVFLFFCGCLCPVPFPQGAVGWPVPG